MKKESEILSRIHSLPAVSTTVTRVAMFLDDPDVNITRVIDAVKYDPGLTANVLKLANSPYFGFPNSINSTRHAMILLGIEQVFRLVIAASFSSFMNKSLAGYGLPEGELWRHSVATAIASEKICRMLDIKIADIAFTAALLHDIGKLIISSFVEKDFAEIESMVRMENESFEVGEEAVLGVNHAEVGAAILSNWGFSGKLIDPVKWHHKPENFEGNSSDLVDIVHIADVLCLMGGIGLGREGLQYRPSKSSLERLKLKTLMLETIVCQTINGMEELRELLEFQ